MRESNQDFSADPVACDVEASDGGAEIQRGPCGSLPSLARDDAISLMSYATRHTTVVLLLTA
jgi:hypothetical protein